MAGKNWKDTIYFQLSNTEIDAYCEFIHMKIIDIIKHNIVSGKPTLSVEIIPPRNGERVEKVLRKVEDLMEVSPDFISITRGAGGSLRGGTVPIAYLIKQKFDIETMAHLTCIDTPVEELENSLIDHWYLDIDNILALRGDPPRDTSPGYGHGRDVHFHKYARDLVRQIKNINSGHYLIREIDIKKRKISPDRSYREGARTDFCISVAGHPEGHPECPDPEIAAGHLKEKVKSGAEFIMTQMVFDPEIYRKFIDQCKALEIHIPIIPGVRPITRYKSIARIENFFAVSVSDNFKDQLKALDKDKARTKGIELTIKLCRDLLKAGAPGIHLYIMNDVSVGKEIITQLR